MGPTKSPKCNAFAKSIWLWCIQKNIWISAAHISGARNEYPDYLSRMRHTTTEWSLREQVFHQIEGVYGSPLVDLFASRFNAKLPSFVSWKPDPIALAVDAFSLDWNDYKFYAFPPFSLVGKCLQKISADKATGILVAPLWTTQPWFVTLLEMLIAHPYMIRLKRDMLTLPGSCQIHPLVKKLNLAICHISGQPYKSKMFRQKQQKLSWQDGDPVHKSNISVLLQSGFHFVVEDRLIRFRPL